MGIIETERLILRPMDDEAMRELIANERDEALKIAYSEMLSGGLQHPAQREWYVTWEMFERTDPTRAVGHFCFLGAPEHGVVEVGYGVDAAYEGRGFMTEALDGIVNWAFTHRDVDAVEAETEADNLASQRVLEKNGFCPTGETGEDGPRFRRRRVNPEDACPALGQKIDALSIAMTQTLCETLWAARPDDRARIRLVGDTVELYLHEHLRVSAFCEAPDDEGYLAVDCGHYGQTHYHPDGMALAGELLGFLDGTTAVAVRGRHIVAVAPLDALRQHPRRIASCAGMGEITGNCG